MNKQMILVVIVVLILLVLAFTLPDSITHAWLPSTNSDTPIASSSMNCNYLTYIDDAMLLYNKRTIDFKCRSKPEAVTRICIESIMEAATGKYYEFTTVRPDSIRNPRTGRSLELDWYNEELKLAIEYNGKQHYSHCGLHKSEQAFIDQMYRDGVKRRRCRELGIHLIEVPFIVSESNIMLYLCMELNRIWYMP